MKDSPALPAAHCTKDSLANLECITLLYHCFISLFYIIVYFLMR